MKKLNRNSDNSSKIVWSVINSEHSCGKRFGHPELYLRNNGIGVSNSRGNAHIFNNFFLMSGNLITAKIQQKLGFRISIRQSDTQVCQPRSGQIWRSFD